MGPSGIISPGAIARRWENSRRVRPRWAWSGMLHGRGSPRQGLESPQPSHGAKAIRAGCRAGRRGVPRTVPARAFGGAYPAPRQGRSLQNSTPLKRGPAVSLENSKCRNPRPHGAARSGDEPSTRARDGRGRACPSRRGTCRARPGPFGDNLTGAFVLRWGEVQARKATESWKRPLSAGL